MFAYIILLVFCLVTLIKSIAYLYQGLSLYGIFSNLYSKGAETYYFAVDFIRI